MTITPNSPLNSYWANFPATYRTEQVKAIAQWIAVGDCGVVVGGSGSGKSNLVGFLAGRPDVLAQQLPTQWENLCLLQLDVNTLPTLTTPNFYRGLLNTLQEAVPQIAPELTGEIAASMAKITNPEDALALYFALQRSHALLIQRTGKKVIWLIDRFDEACKRLEAGTLSSLRSLRDQCKGQLVYIVFTRFPLACLRNPAEFDEFHEIMVTHTCWVGPMVARDAQWIAQQMAALHQTTFAPADVAQLCAVTGGLPAFMKAACAALATGYLVSGEAPTTWVEKLLAQPVFQRNCQEIWGDCTEAERALLTVLATGGEPRGLAENCAELVERGLVIQESPPARLRIFAPLLAAFVKQQGGNASPGLTLDARTGAVLRAGIPLPAAFTHLEMRLLGYFLDHAGALCEKHALIAHVWLDEQLVEGIRDDSLAQLVKRLRDKIEGDGQTQSVIQNVRGRGYRFVQAT